MSENSKLADLFEAESVDTKKAVDAPNVEKTQELTNLIKELRNLEERIARGESLLKDLKKQALLINQVSIPEIFQEMGNLKEMTLLDEAGGEYKVTVQPDITVSIGDEGKAFQFMENHKYGSIIKSSMSLSFGKGEEEAQEVARKALKSADLEFEEKRGIHHSTLKSTVKKLMEKGTSIPEDIFKLYSYTKTVIK